MIMFTSGFPYSGKSTIAKLLKEKLNDDLVLHIDPKEYYPDNYDVLVKEERTDVAITAWEMSLEKAHKAICSVPDKVLIILDTCCSKSLHMRPLFMDAKLRGHTTMLMFVSSNLEDCVSRAKTQMEKDVIKDKWDYYRECFMVTIPELNKHADVFGVVHNTNETNLQEIDLNVFLDKVESIRK